MVTIGNDVVDLGDPETAAGACHARFDTRVFAPGELAALAASGAPRRLRWALWAAKEAAYKAARKRDPRIPFVPRRFVVQLHGGASATVHLGARLFTVSLASGPRHVHAVARTCDEVAPVAGNAARVTATHDDTTAAARDDARIVARIAAIPAPGTTDPSEAVRALALSTLADLLGHAPATLAIAREGRIPRVYDARGPLAMDLSLSHHGRLVAFACALPAPRAALEQHA